MRPSVSAAHLLFPKLDLAGRTVQRSGQIRFAMNADDLGRFVSL
jgi:hypothetical protein